MCSCDRFAGFPANVYYMQELRVNCHRPQSMGLESAPVSLPDAEHHYRMLPEFVQYDIEIKMLLVY